MSFANKYLSIAIASFSLGLSSIAHADGMVMKPAQLGAQARATLVQQVEAYRATHPEDFDAVKNVKSHRPEVYRTFRNPVPIFVARELRELGPGALIPMLEALALKAPERGSLTDDEWQALAAGMVEAVSVLRDPRSMPVVGAIFEGAPMSKKVTAAAARALGRAGGDMALALLTKHAAAGDKLELAAIEGLGQLRRPESAKVLAKKLAAAKAGSEVADAAVHALGQVGSSWAWRALGASAEADALTTRASCAEALAGHTLRARSSEERNALAEATLMVSHPSSVQWLRGVRDNGDADHSAFVDGLIGRVERQLKQ